jgi:hypothetical protein
MADKHDHHDHDHDHDHAHGDHGHGDHDHHDHSAHQAPWVAVLTLLIAFGVGFALMALKIIKAG